MPAIAIISILLIAAIAGGIAWRLRGSGIVPNWVARFILWGGSVTLAVYAITSCPLFLVPPMIVLAGIGASFGYYGSFDVTLPSSRTFENYSILTIMGMMRFLPFCLTFTAIGYVTGKYAVMRLGLAVIPAVIAGAGFVPCYYAGWGASKIKLPFLRVPSEWGELFFGALIYSALVAGLLWWYIRSA